MPEHKEITYSVLEDYDANNRLGKIHLLHPNGELEVDLHLLLHETLGPELYVDRYAPEDINSVVLFGSTLWEHYTTQEEVFRGKKYVFWGDDVMETVTKFPKRPNDVDLLVILNREPFEEKRDLTSTFTSRGNAFYRETNLEGPVGLKRHDYPGTENYLHSGGILHLNYISDKDFMEGAVQSNPIAEQTIRQGVPIINPTQFESLVDKIGFRSPSREPFHRIDWVHSQSGKLTGVLGNSGKYNKKP